MAYIGRITALVGAGVLASAAFASGDSYTWTWNPGMENEGVYSLNWSGYVEEGNADSLIDPGDFISAGALSQGTASILRGKVAAVIDPAYIGYDLVAFNATISGIFIVSVTDTANVTFSGATWVSSVQVGNLYHFAGLGFSGSSNIFTPGPATLAYAGAPDGDGLASMGAFSPAVSNIALAPVLTAIDPNNPFGVTVTGIPVPEPASIAAVGLGLLAIAARRRRNR
jgi:hypothetical protein